MFSPVHDRPADVDSPAISWDRFDGETLSDLENGGRLGPSGGVSSSLPFFCSTISISNYPLLAQKQQSAPICEMVKQAGESSENKL
jgi:hypothetical protein